MCKPGIANNATGYFLKTDNSQRNYFVRFVIDITKLLGMFFLQNYTELFMY